MKLKARRLSVVLCAVVGVVIWLCVNPASYDLIFAPVENNGVDDAVAGGGASDGDGGSDVGAGSLKMAPYKHRHAWPYMCSGAETSALSDMRISVLRKTPSAYRHCIASIFQKREICEENGRLRS